MKPSKRWLVVGIIWFASGLLVYLSPDGLGRVVPLLLVGWSGYCFYRGMGLRRSKRARPGQATPPQDNALPRQIEQEISSTSDNVDLSVLGTQKAREQWKEAEAAVDETLDACINLVKLRMQAHTVAVFFAAEGGGYRMRRFSSQCEFVNAEAIIRPGVGVIGSFLKDGLKQLSLSEIVSDSMTLYYYTRDARIRSLAASPIVAAGVERGVIIVDSTEEKHFKDDDHTFLANIANVCGGAVYYAYRSTEHRIKYDKFAAVTNVEKYFFHKQDIESVLEKMAEIIPYAIPCTRVTLSLRSTLDPTRATVHRASGPDEEGFFGKSFSLNGKSLMSLLYSKNMCFFRDFADDRYETRYFEGEPRTAELRSFLAFPIGVDGCKGGILLESVQPEAFTDSHRALLLRFATSAGLAIEKILLLEQAQALATHDGLTGLNNHRQFQKLLRDEITRAERYADPLALVLCDIDHFKKVNDTHGHPFGDQVLRGVSACLRDSIRDGVDVAARYGGEEFALVFVKTDAQTAVETVDRIRQKIAQLAFHTTQGETMRCTMSFGLAVFGAHGKDGDALVQKADKALYRAKENGRNRVEMF